jgi:tetratricopeptide (TPR) repeat protein
MSGNTGSLMRVAGAAVLGIVALVQPAPLSAQSYARASESPSDSLGRHMRVLATSPRDFTALIGAGRAALALGDSQAAAGFFGRAEEVWPASPLPQIGIGASLVQEGDAAAALAYFTAAAQRGAAASQIAVERGLAYDLLGNHAQAQADYRLALAGADGDEARRRLALSLAITGNKAEALQQLAPLIARRDAGAARTRALVLALSGDAAGARSAIESALPGSAAQMDYFFRRLPTLASRDKAAAVHLGTFPSGEVASAAPVVVPQGDRLASIDQLLRGNPAPNAGATTQATPAPSGSLAARTVPPARGSATRSAASAGADGRLFSSSRIWLQLASGSNATALPGEFRRIRARDRELFEGISGYFVEEGGRARLLIGPFRNAREAEIFREDLASIDVDAFNWTNTPGQIVRKLPAE